MNPRVALPLVIVLSVLAAAPRLGAQLPNGQYVQILLEDVFDPEGSYSVGNPFRIKVEGVAGLWVGLMAYAYVDVLPWNNTGTVPAGLYTQYPWLKAPNPLDYSASVPEGTYPNLEVPYGVFLDLYEASAAPHPSYDYERAVCQPILLPAGAQNQPWGAPGMSRYWTTNCDSWSQNAVEPPGSAVQSLWTAALWKEESLPGATDKWQYDAYDPKLLLDALFVRQSGSKVTYDAFLDAKSSELMQAGSGIFLTIQPFAIGSIPGYSPAISDPLTGPFKPEQENSWLAIALGQIVNMAFSLGEPATAVRHAGYHFNGVPISHQVYETYVLWRSEGNAYPAPTLTLQAGRNTYTLAGRFHDVGWMRFNLPSGQSLTAGSSVSILSVQNVLGLLPGFGAGVSNPVSLGPLTVIVEGMNVP